jgi:hypothetical protein
MSEGVPHTFIFPLIQPEIGGLFPATLEGLSYPDLGFGFNFDQSFQNVQPIDSPAGVVQEVIRVLEHTVRFDLEPEFQAHILKEESYRYKVSKLNYINRYLAGSVTNLSSKNGQKMRRCDIVGLDMAVDEVIDDLALSNHPVSQILAQLYLEQGSFIGNTSTRFVFNEVIKLTQWNRLNRILTSHIEHWRLGVSLNP